MMQLEQSSRDWEIWRQDDAGNRYLMVAGLSETEARRMLAEYERRGHKQLYWVQRSAGTSRSAQRANEE